MTSTLDDLHAFALEAEAERHCRMAREIARRNAGGLLIGGTKQGLIDLSYDPASRTYRIARQGLDPFPGGQRAFTQLRKAGAVTRLCDLYEVL